MLFLCPFFLVDSVSWGMKTIYAIIFACLQIASAADKHPNIVLINADDLGYGDLSCYGAKMINTPNIDRLAREGRKYTDAHSPSAVCSPSRYGLLTGDYPFRANLWGPMGGKNSLVLPLNKENLPKVLKKAGYATAVIGKWHLGLTHGVPDYNKLLKPGTAEVGFDYSFIIPTVNSGPPFVYAENGLVVGLDPNDPIILGKRKDAQHWAKDLPEKGGEKTYSGGRKAHEIYKDFEIGTKLTEQSIKWIAKQKEKPFFLYLATTNIHHPFTPAKQFQGTSECGAYGDFIHELDWVVGEVVKAAEESSRESNRETLIIFTSDNGGMLNHTAQQAWKKGHRANGNLFGYKFGVWEGGHRIPLIIKWTGKVPAGTISDQLVSQIDFTATFADLTNQPTLKHSDGVSLLPDWLGKATSPLRKELAVLANSSKHLSIRTKRWLYIPAQASGGFSGKWGSHTCGGVKAISYTKRMNSDIANGKIKPDAPKAQLYDLQNDLEQKNNVILEYPEVAKELQNRVNFYKAQIPKTKKVGWIAPGNH